MEQRVTVLELGVKGFNDRLERVDSSLKSIGESLAKLVEINLQVVIQSKDIESILEKLTVSKIEVDRLAIKEADFMSRLRVLENSSGINNLKVSGAEKVIGTILTLILGAALTYWTTM